MRPPGQVIEVARTLQNAGFEAWCVGGAVRDALLGLAHLDWDLATSATPPEVRRLFKRTVPVGIEFGTIGVLDRDGRMHEVTTFRHDVRTDGRHAEVEFGASLDEDLARRDFTINAIAYDPIARVLRDPFEGQADLQRGVVRAVGNADARMREDRLRALRAIRFAARFDFAIEEATWLAIVASAPFLTRLSPERVKQELDKTMEQVVRPSDALARWRESGAFASLVPTLADAPDSLLRAVDALPVPGLSTRPLRKPLRFAALFSGHDGKAAEQAMRALRFSNQDITTVSVLVDRYARFGASLGDQLASGSAPSGADLRRLAAAVGRLRVAAFLRLCAARWATDDRRVEPRTVRALYRQLLRIAFNEAIEVADLAVDGDDLRRAGIAAGPHLGQTLQRLLDAVIDDPACNTRETLLSLAAHPA
ncbi:CCA tRNA nucleotidyltransferase [Gemmatimonas phototrophica]|uniref:CCA tRNA nucleotidyltransferase n=1 Tax=Gemmatimonas phototrophica TaxID=1379270 RepID=UPI001314D879|nr:tRNA cytidylyltransferase [Gemmatimonas phototrophica]